MHKDIWNYLFSLYIVYTMVQQRVYTKKRRFTYKKRTPIKKKGYRRSLKVMRIPPRITMNQQFYTISFAKMLTIPATSTGTIGFQNVNIASVYDPLGSGGTRQFYGVSNLFSLYKYITVLTNKISLQALAPYGDTTPAVVMMTQQYDSSADTNLNDISDMYETPLRKSEVKMFGNYITKNLRGNDTINMMYTAKKFFGPSFDSADRDYASTIAGNPTIGAHAGIYYTTPNITSSTEFNMMLRMSAIVRCWGPIVLNNSG